MTTFDPRTTALFLIDLHAEDATTSLTAELHTFSVEHIPPRIGIVSRAADIRLEQA